MSEAAIIVKSAGQAGWCWASGILDFQRVPTVPQLTSVAPCVQTICTDCFMGVDISFPPGSLGFWPIPGRGYQFPVNPGR